MQLLDWLIVALPLLVVGAVTAYANRYLKSVADFMSGGRLAGRYLLSTARSEMGAGAIGYVAMFEWFGHGGFSVTWWQQLAGPVGLVIAITGFVIYRYRQTRALTLAQFFEMRYSRNFRFVTGVLGFIAGILNFGVIPVVGGKFMVHFLDLPQTLPFFSFAVPTYLVLMGGFLTITTLITITGGQITVMIADCIQGMISQVFYVIIAVFLIAVFSWPETRAMLLSYPPGHSMVNPFDTRDARDFNLGYVLMGIFTGIYGTMAWQNNQGFNSAAATPHESRMGNVLGRWRGFALNTSMLLLAVAAMTYLHQPAGHAAIDHRLAQIADAQTREQMTLPLGLAAVLPLGIKGLLVSVVLMGIFGGDGQHLHSWGSIFAQDVVLPLCPRPLSTRAHLLLLRGSIIGVALFAFVFGALFTQTEYLPMWFNVTMAIFVGGAGAAIIGGLYWSRGTTAGAWAGLILGSSLSTGGILLRQPACHDLAELGLNRLGLQDSPWSRAFLHYLGPNSPLNGTEIGFIATLIALTGYVSVSLFTCRVPHDMDRLLHRGRHAVEPETPPEQTGAGASRSRFHVHNIVGIDEHYTRGDRWVALGIFWWSIFWFAIFVIGSAWYLVHPWSDDVWAEYWLLTGVYLPLLISLVTTVWFTIGCWSDLMSFFRRLKTERIDTRDDGTVTHPSEDPPSLAERSPRAATAATN
ncbi:MAG: sodium:proline symporter [Verrucomicrobiota bacterium]